MPIENHCDKSIDQDTEKENKDFLLEEKYVYDENGKYKYTNDIIYTDKKSGKSFSFRTLFSKNLGFAPRFISLKLKPNRTFQKQTFHADITSNIVWYPPLKTPDDILGILHEIGHIHSKENIEKIDMSRKELEQYLFCLPGSEDDFLEQLEESKKMLAKNPEKIVWAKARIFVDSEKVDAALDKLTKGNLKQKDYRIIPVPKEIMEKFIYYVAKSEHDAWNLAIEDIKKCKGQEIDLLPNYSTEEIEKYTHEMMNTYRLQLEREYIEKKGGTISIDLEEYFTLGKLKKFEEKR